jgi:SAM-dependent methyltransferase
MIVRRTEAGTSWAELARLDPLAAVLDPADTRGGKNKLIDRVHKRALARASGDVRGRRVLDFGCGTGRLSDWLVRHGADVDGVDVTPEMIAVAQALVPEGRFQTTDGSTLPFADGSFDLVVTTYVLQYYAEGDRAVPRELVRVLRSGGRLIAIEQVTGSDIGRGGARSAYERMLGEAGFKHVDVSLIRMGDSRTLGVASRFPAFSRLPIVAWLVMREAARSEDAQLTDGRYADGLFQAVKES